MTANPDDEWLLIQRIQRDRLVFRLAIGIMALGAAMCVVGFGGVMINLLSDSKYWGWFALGAGGSIIDLGTGALLHLYMKKTPSPFAPQVSPISSSSAEQVAQRNHLVRITARIGRGFINCSSLLGIAGGLGFFSHWIITGDLESIWIWVPACLVAAVFLIIVGGVVAAVKD